MPAPLPADIKKPAPESHLRSTREICGYSVEANDGPVGKVADLTIDGRTGAIRELVVECGHWYSGKKVVISTDKVSRVSFDQSTIYVDSTKLAFSEAMEQMHQ